MTVLVGVEPATPFPSSVLCTSCAARSFFLSFLSTLPSRGSVWLLSALLLPSQQLRAVVLPKPFSPHLPHVPLYGRFGALTV